MRFTPKQTRRNTVTVTVSEVQYDVASNFKTEFEIRLILIIVIIVVHCTVYLLDTAAV